MNVHCMLCIRQLSASNPRGITMENHSGQKSRFGHIATIRNIVGFVRITTTYRGVHLIPTGLI